MATDSRERTLEALERRIHTEHILFEKKKPINEDRKSPILAPSASNVSSLHLCHPSSDTLNKGNSYFSCWINTLIKHLSV